jgi:hypothetical protein
MEVVDSVSERGRRVVRELAKRVAELAALPVQDERIRLWKAFNALKPERPMVLCFPEGGWRDLVKDSHLECEDETLRRIEYGLRTRIFQHERIGDDQVVTDRWHVHVAVRRGGFGLEVPTHRTAELGAFNWDAPIKEAADLEKLHVRSIEVDWPATHRSLEFHRDLFGDILQVDVTACRHPHGQFPHDVNMLRGLDTFMMDMIDNPDLLHRLNAILLESAMHELDVLEAEGALRLNNLPDSYCGTGGIGCTDELPAADFEDTVRVRDLWGLAESQEFVGVGPKHFEEFAIQYQATLMERFGLAYYGCCEPLHNHLDAIIAGIPNLRAVSVAPWCDREIAAEKLQDKYLYYWKPNPTMTCTPVVNWDEVARVTRETLEIARGCCVAMVLKDTHTFCGDAERPGRWVDIARGAVEAFV